MAHQEPADGLMPAAAGRPSWLAQPGILTSIRADDDHPLVQWVGPCFGRPRRSPWRTDRSFDDGPLLWLQQAESWLLATALAIRHGHR